MRAVAGGRRERDFGRHLGEGLAANRWATIHGTYGLQMRAEIGRKRSDEFLTSLEYELYDKSDIICSMHRDRGSKCLGKLSALFRPTNIYDTLGCYRNTYWLVAKHILPAVLN
jgi:hypothetical protein